MKRQSYFQQIAPHSAAKIRDAMPVIKPAPLLFRPSTTPVDLIEVHEQRSQEALRSARLPTASPARHAAGAPRGLRREAAPAAPLSSAPTLGDRARGPHVGATSVRGAGEPAASSPAQVPSTPAVKLRTPVAQNRREAASTLRESLQPDVHTAEIPIQPPQRISTAVEQEPAIVALAKAAAVQIAGSARLITPPVLSPRPATLQATRPNSARTLHIGSLEVTVAPPAPAAASTSAAPARGSARAAGHRQTRPNSRLMRRFGVFGLGQS
jgi:hypothetical protein